MEQYNHTPQIPYALEGDELGQRVYSSLRAPIQAAINGNALSEDAQARLQRAEAYLASRVSASEMGIAIAEPASDLGRIAVEDHELPFSEEDLGEAIKLS